MNSIDLKRFLDEVTDMSNYEYSLYNISYKTFPDKPSIIKYDYILIKKTGLKYECKGETMVYQNFCEKLLQFTLKGAKFKFNCEKND